MSIINFADITPEAVDTFPRRAIAPAYADTPIPVWIENSIRANSPFALTVTRDEAEVIARLIREYLNDGHKDLGFSRRIVKMDLNGEDSGDEKVRMFIKLHPRIKGRGRRPVAHTNGDSHPQNESTVEPPTPDKVTKSRGATK